jgi:K(+)-stimulated pyrophosphate-energized sodium pump
MAALNKGSTSAPFYRRSYFVILFAWIENWLVFLFFCIAGLLAGIVIGKGTEYFTSHAYKPTQNIAKSAQTGPATVIISGIGSGMISTVIPVASIVIAILIAYLSAIGFDVKNMLTPENLGMGLYGFEIAAVGMLSTLGITLATDAYGPIADQRAGKC